ncbi:MAG: TIGR03087 family PEP-CTERM/XrtA system glycosyltransferase [Planctomycetes bacterium]|nr:TIGR03087 family PEP-CTERM/XrtA system glycosyltransferase [Planctomycetota bacterium]
MRQPDSDRLTIDVRLDNSPRILYLVHRVPYPPNRGDRIRSFHLLKFLSTLGKVDLATLADEPLSDGDRQTLAESCNRVAIFPLAGITRWLRAAAALASGNSATEGLFRSTPLHKTVKQWSREVQYDAVVVFCSSMAPYAMLPELKSARLLVDLVDVDSQKWLDYASTATFPRNRLYALEARRVRQLECQIVERADSVILTSPQEVETLQKFKPNDKTRSVTNGVDLDYFAPDVVTAATPGALCVFVGVLDYRANIDGLQWFCSEVWPEVRRRIPDATLQIIGRRPTPQVLRLAQIDGVQVIGEVSDVRPYALGAEISIAPLRVARGIQNKVLEAMAMGRPVVATPQALEGLNLVPGEHAIAAGSVEDWVTALERLHRDATERRRLGDAARALVIQRHAWESCLAPIDALLGLTPLSCGARESEVTRR